MRWGRLTIGLVLGAVPLPGLGACSSEAPTQGRFADATLDPAEEAGGPDAGGGLDGPRDALDAQALLDGAANDAGEAGPAGDAGACAPPSPCASARDLGSISGDANQDTVSAQGTTSQWLQLRVTQSVTHYLSGDMKATFSLVSPSGANFDLYVYYDPEQDVVVCSPPEAASSTQQAGISDTLSLTWGHALTSTADARTISVEVRWVSGPCDPGQPWTLLVQGNK